MLKSNIEKIEFLLAKGGDVNAVDKNGNTYLHHAAGRGDIKTVKLLLARGADINKANFFGNIPFLFAVKNNHIEIVELLFNEKILEKDKTEAFIYAINKNYIKIVKLLLYRYIDFNDSDFLNLIMHNFDILSANIETFEFLLNNAFYRNNFNLYNKNIFSMVLHSPERTEKRKILCKILMANGTTFKDIGVFGLHDFFQEEPGILEKIQKLTTKYKIFKPALKIIKKDYYNIDKFIDAVSTSCDLRKLIYTSKTMLGSEKKDVSSNLESLPDVLKNKIFNYLIGATNLSNRNLKRIIALEDLKISLSDILEEIDITKTDISTEYEINQEELKFTKQQSKYMRITIDKLKQDFLMRCSDDIFKDILDKCKANQAIKLEANKIDQNIIRSLAEGIYDGGTVFAEAAGGLLGSTIGISIINTVTVESAPPLLLLAGGIIGVYGGGYASRKLAFNAKPILGKYTELALSTIENKLGYSKN